MIREKFRSHFTRLLAPVLLGAALCCTLNGCGWRGDRTKVGSAASASPTGYAWDGQASGYAFHATVAVCTHKAQAALRHTGFMLKPGESNPTGRPATLVAYDKESNRAEVTVKRVTQKQTEVKVRVGTLGYRTASESVLEAIRVSIESDAKSKE